MPRIAMLSIVLCSLTVELASGCSQEFSPEPSAPLSAGGQAMSATAGLSGALRAGAGGAESRAGSSPADGRSGGAGRPSGTAGQGGATAGRADGDAGGSARAGVGGDANTATAGQSGAGGAAAHGGAPLQPEHGAWLGLYYGAGSIAATASKLGRTPLLHLTYYAWTDDWSRGSQSDLDAGRIPLVNWEPFDTALDDIIAGDYDALIAERAADAKRLAKPFFLDWGAEMNGDWSPWGGAQNGQSADKYVQAYRHIHDLFVKGGATNVVWLWCPNVTDEPAQSWNAALNYYPGDTYVDWTCVDGYNWGSTNGGAWQSFEQVFERIYPKLAGKNKPIMIGEMASTELGGDKAQWIDGVIPSLKAKFPSIRGVVWFDIDKETDWRISSSSGAEQAFVRMANDAYFNP